MRPAEARLKPSMEISSSIRLLLTGWQVDWTTKTSEPRTDSLIDRAISPSEKVLTCISPSGSPSARAICSANGRLALQLKILMSLPWIFMIKPLPHCSP